MSAIDDLLKTQDGHFIWEDAARLGITRREVRTALRTGAVAHVGKCAYIAARRTTPEERHRRRTIALLRAQPDRIATHHSAAVLHGLPVYGNDWETVHFGRVKASARTGTAWVLHRLPEAIPTTTVGQSLQVTSVTSAVAAVQCAIAWGPRAGLVTIDAVLRQADGTSPGTRGDTAIFDSALACYSRSPGISRARAALALADARRESPAESLAAFELFSLHVKASPQWAMGLAGHEYRADFRVDGTNVLIEIDGFGKYTSADDVAAEKRREATLRDAGYEVVRFTWEDLGNRDLIRYRLTGAIARSSGRTLLP